MNSDLTLKRFIISKYRFDFVKDTDLEDFPSGTVDKNLPANAEDTGLIPGPGISHMWRSN